MRFFGPVSELVALLILFIVVCEFGSRKYGVGNWDINVLFGNRRDASTNGPEIGEILKSIYLAEPFFIKKGLVDS